MFHKEHCLNLCLRQTLIENHFGFKNYRGPGQALLLIVLHMPENEILLVILQLVRKSLLCQGRVTAKPQHTAVVVPTVALALDQEITLIENQGLQPKHLCIYWKGH